MTQQGCKYERTKLGLGPVCVPKGHCGLENFAKDSDRSLQMPRFHFYYIGYSCAILMFSFIFKFYLILFLAALEACGNGIHASCIGSTEVLLCCYFKCLVSFLCSFIHPPCLECLSCTQCQREGNVAGERTSQTLTAQGEWH